TASTVARGSLWSVGGQAVTLLASFFATRFVVHRLPPDSYGVLVLVNVLVGYLAFADMGMGVASTKFATEAHAEGDAEEAKVVWTAALIAAVPSLLAAALLPLFAPPLAPTALPGPAH